MMHIPMTGQWSMSRAIKEAKPDAVRVCDIVKQQHFQPARRSRVAAFARKCVDAAVGSTRQRIQIDPNHKSPLGAFIAITQLISMQTRYGFTSTVLAPEQKNQTEARRRADFHNWIEAEWIEMDTVYRDNMGTIQFVPTSDLPFGTTLIPTKFACKCKFGDKGQHESEYTETFAPTSRFNALRMLMSIAVQQSYKLVNFDVKGAFMVSGIEDQDIYVQLPPGYASEAQTGFTARLAWSLYGLRDSAARFHKTLSDWMMEYCFTALDADRTMFKLERDGKVIIVAFVKHRDVGE
eukprot:3283834-Rhodomonas_salina.1